MTEELEQLLKNLKLRRMLGVYDEQLRAAEKAQASYSEFVAGLLRAQWHEKQESALEWRIRRANLPERWSLESFPWARQPGVNRKQMRTFAELDFVAKHENLVLTGPTGIGKTWLARAFAQKACRDGYTALFFKAAELFREFVTARADGSHPKLLERLGRVDLLIVDDWAMAPMTEIERRDFLEVCDTRYQTRSTMLTSQLPVGAWHAQIGDPTIADSILDRLVHNAHRIEMQGESMRKKRGGKNGMEI